MASLPLLKAALIGNPNSGKTSLFNQLTGLNQKIGNFPGVTVDKKTGICKLTSSQQAEIVDLPGTYSLYPKSADEQVVMDYLFDAFLKETPDFLIVVIDASTLERNLLLFTQVRDLGFPVILALNMLDLAKKDGKQIDIDKLIGKLNVPIIPVNARTGEGIEQIKFAMACPVRNPPERYLKPIELASDVVPAIKEHMKIDNDYMALLLAHQYEGMLSLSEYDKAAIRAIVKANEFQSTSTQSAETLSRYSIIRNIIKETIFVPVLSQENNRWTERIDKVLTHKIYGFALFFLVLFVMFQAIFAWAQVPMDMIDEAIGFLKLTVQKSLPPGALTDLITEGLIAGLGGVLIFIPQIAILFGFISVLEETGYMSRVMYIMDKAMRQFGLSGKSVVPLISGVACAVPAIMATRSIDNWKERLITILVTPFMSCSARIPVYTVLIALVIPSKPILGVFNLQGIVMMGLYLLGFMAAILSAVVLHWILRSKERGYFIMELPSYKMPRWKNVGLAIVEKVKTFVFEAGKIILAISIVLWVLATYGPRAEMEKLTVAAKQEAQIKQYSLAETENYVASKKLEASYAGHFGKLIEPVIKPLGFDWKIGIALITSFAAREVFIGTMATIYSIGDQAEESDSVIQKMKSEKDPETGAAFYNIARSLSLLVFYVFAMQCMSTLAVVYRETKSWKWPIVQFVFMTAVAYVSSFVVYSLFK
ncbi:MAG TPA: ferrous iron transport protein B [Cytophagaceae bacterium]|jgi:ferrous iron transport protein B|nr:ferrous iron transport protein B [Cytophagaceae bacterium]